MVKDININPNISAAMGYIQVLSKKTNHDGNIHFYGA
jgi:hypothetical protein